MKKSAFAEEISRIVKDIRTRWTLWAALVAGLASYIFVMTNNIHNNDSLIATPSGVGATVTSGRFVLELIERIQNTFSGQWYNSTTFNTILSLVLLTLASILLVRCFDLSSKISVIAVTALTVSFPAIAVTMVFNYCAHCYSFAILLVAAGCYLLSRKSFRAWIVGVVFFAGMLGIYQSYLALVIVIFLLMLIRESLRNDVKFADVLLKGIRYILSIVLSYVLYRLLLGLCLKIMHLELDTYQGINTMGEISLGSIPGLIGYTYKNMLGLVVRNYAGLNGTPVSKVIIALALLAVIAFIVIAFAKGVKPSRVIWAIIFTALMPIACDFMEIMAPGAYMGTHSLMSAAGMFYLSVVWGESLLQHRAVRTSRTAKAVNLIAAILLLLASINYCYTSNVNYTSLKYQLQVQENYYAELYTRIQSAEGYEAGMDIVLAGEEAANVPANYWDIGDLQYHSASIDTNAYSKERFMQLYLGDTFRNADEADIAANADILAEMKVYPSAGSVKISDGVVLVKIGE